MNGIAYIQRKQCAWAKRNGIEVVGSTFQNEGKRNYVESLEDNFFQELKPEILNQLNEGDGGELKSYVKGGKHYRPKSNALHSSAVIVVNMFQYWLHKDVYQLLYTCKLCSKQAEIEKIITEQGVSNQPKKLSVSRNIRDGKIDFEVKLEISKDKSKFPRIPNIDIVISDFRSRIFAIESKFSEPYRKNHPGLKKVYLDSTSFWHGLPNLYELAKEISPDDNKFKYLDAPQLIKHILGLKMNYKKSDWMLLYLWYDVIGHDGAEHRKEIERFAEIAKSDKVKFRYITYQEAILEMAEEFYDGNEGYCNYLTNRYL